MGGSSGGCQLISSENMALSNRLYNGAISPLIVSKLSGIVFTGGHNSKERPVSDSFLPSSGQDQLRTALSELCVNFYLRVFLGVKFWDLTGARRYKAI